MKLQLLLVTLTLVMEVCGLPDAKVKSEFARLLTPENCASSEPSALYFKHLRPGLASEQAQDAFHEVYAEVLTRRTDQQFPDAAKFRKSLLLAFIQTFEFIRTANGHTATAHQMTRLPAEVEWTISQGFESKFDNGVSGEYTLDDIRNLAHIYQQSQRQNTIGQDLSHIQAEILEPALNQLKIAERMMSKEAIVYFRAKLVSMIAEYIGR